MLNFLTPETLLNNLGMSQTPDYVGYAETALDDAMHALSSDLRCDFDLVTGQTDVFAPNENDPYTKLKLTYGYVNPATVPVVTQYSNWETLAEFQGTSIMPFANTDPLLTSAALLTPNCTFDYIKGVVKVNNLRIRGRLITVVYNSGFGPDAKDPSLYDQTLVPDWLIKLCNLRARIDLSAHPAFNESKAVYNPKALEEHYGTIVARWTRYCPDAILTV